MSRFLRTSLLIPIAALFVLMAGATLFAAYQLNIPIMREWLRENEIGQARALKLAIEARLAEQIRHVRTMGRLVADSQELGEAVVLAQREPNNPAALTRLRAAVEELYAKAELGELTLYGADDTVLIRARDLAPGGQPSSSWGTAEALRGFDSLGSETVAKSILLYSVYPLQRSGKVVAAIKVGVSLDASFAKAAALEFGADISIVNEKSVIASSLTTESSARVDFESVTRAYAQRTEVYRHDAERRRTLVYVPYQLVDETLCVVIGLDASPAYTLLERHLRWLSLVLLLIGAIIALAAMALMYFPVLRPINRLKEEAERTSRDLLEGDLLVPERGNEIARLGASLRHMRQGLIDRASEVAAGRDAAEKASRAKSDFLSTMSHEIRTPLNGILGMAELLNGTVLDATQKRHCDAIVNSGRALRDLLGDILDLSKIEAGKLELESETFDLSVLLEDLVESYRELSLARGNRLTLEQRFDGGARFVGDALRLRQIVTNLVSNAIKFTENGAIDIRAEAREGEDKAARTVRMSVRDSGIGMSPETLARVFEPFQQADSSTTRQFGGTGLGLSISRRLVDLMGGELKVNSKPGEGTEFIVELPLAVATLPMRSEQSGQMVAFASPPDRPLKVLLVEDNDINQDVGCAMLEAAGHSVEIAEDGAVAVRKFREASYDCILMDCQMPVMDGFEATRRIRDHEATTGAARTPIIALTANALTGDRERCLAAGMDAFVSKPFTRIALIGAVNAAFASRAR